MNISSHQPQVNIVGGIFSNEYESTNSSNISQDNSKLYINKTNNNTFQSESKNTTYKSQMKERNAFINSQGDSSFLQIEESQKQIKLNQRTINDLTKKFANKRYGKNNERMIVKYIDMASRFIKSEEMRSSLDDITKLEANLFNCIISDFALLSTIQIYSDKCCPKDFQKLEERIMKENRNISIKDIINRGEGQVQQQTKTTEAKCSQNSKINCTILPGLLKNIQINSSLKIFHIIHYRFSKKSWQQLGEVIGQSKSITILSFNACNLNVKNYMEVFMTGIQKNEILEKIDFSDNELTDSQGLLIIQYIKRQAENRDNALWMTGLRHTNMDKEQITKIDKDLQMLNLVIQPNTQLHVFKDCFNRYNTKKEQIQYKNGLREVIIKRNKLGDKFAESLIACIKFDSYLKVLEIPMNQISLQMMKDLIKTALFENTSLVNFDARYNPGCNEKCRKQIALCLLRNIEQMKKKDIDIKDEWIKPEILTFKIPNKILESLGIERANTTFEYSKSGTLKTIQSNGSREEGSLSKLKKSRNNKSIAGSFQKQVQKSINVDNNASEKKKLLQKSSIKKEQSISSKKQMKNKQNDSQQNQIILSKQKIQQQEEVEQDDGIDQIQLTRSRSHNDFQVSNMNKNSKKIDFSIVEQKIEPIEMFPNLSECNLKELSQAQRQTQSFHGTSHSKQNKQGCDRCKTNEKQCFITESKYLKALDKIKILKQQILEDEEEIQYLANTGSLLPQSQEDLNLIQQLAKQEPDRIVERLGFLMTELNFLMDFSKMNPKIKDAISQYIFQLIEIAEEKNLLLEEDQQQFVQQQQLNHQTQKNNENKKNVQNKQEKKNDQNIFQKVPFANQMINEGMKNQELNVDYFEDYPHPYNMEQLNAEGVNKTEFNIPQKLMYQGKQIQDNDQYNDYFDEEFDENDV